MRLLRRILELGLYAIAFLQAYGLMLRPRPEPYALDRCRSRKARRA